ncbi:hypothetical protein GQ55_2G404100 [Panicum hallii var. hallii]|uniref:Uncharacterized protein n=1 Tax=Panicum hallii var. hallii TaxID=1504633 RepID=A0A2T7EXK8_9POAL|nr:hypothetical protein GQ55_2G404100 [Panicum hallii var. hallii]
MTSLQLQCASLCSRALAWKRTQPSPTKASLRSSSSPHHRHGSSPVLHCGGRWRVATSIAGCSSSTSSVRWVWTPWIRRATGVCADRTTAPWLFLVSFFQNVHANRAIYISGVKLCVLPAMVFLASFLFSPSPPSDTLSEEHNTFRPGSARVKLRYRRQLVAAGAGGQASHRGIELHHGPVQPRQRQPDRQPWPVNILRVWMMIAEAAAALQACPVTPTGKETYSARRGGQLSWGGEA